MLDEFVDGGYASGDVAVEGGEVVEPPGRERFEEMLQPGPDGPISMVNLLKFRDRAQYEDGRETALTGEEAYAIYGRGVAGLLPRYGGEIVFAAGVTFLALGQVEDLGDEIAIVRYPNRAALFHMSTWAEWRALAVHRSAGLAGQLNIETVARRR